MYTAKVQGTRAGESNADVSINAARGKLTDKLAVALYTELPRLLMEVLERTVETNEMRIDTADLLRPSAAHQPPVQVWVGVERNNGALGTAGNHHGRDLADLLDQFINDCWLPGDAKSWAQDAQVTQIEVIVSLHDTASVTYDRLTGNRMLR